MGRTSEMRRSLEMHPVRVALAVLIGAVAAVATAATGHAAYAPLVGWDVAAVTLLAGWARLFATLSTDEVEARATALDAQRGVWDVVVLLASLASLAAVAVLLLRRGNASPGTVALALVSVVLSWAVVHCSYTVHYAALHFDEGGPGIDFGDARPTFHDFAYLAFTIGMTYQVSDTTLRTPRMRRAVLRHALVSFVFGTTIIATTINLVASLLG